MELSEGTVFRQGVETDFHENHDEAGSQHPASLQVLGLFCPTVSTLNRNTYKPQGHH
jgi:hypothetical protein